MPKFLAGRHYNEEEISHHLEKMSDMAGPNEWQQACNQSNPEKTGRSCEGADFSWLSSKVSRTHPAPRQGGLRPRAFSLSAVWDRSGLGLAWSSHNFLSKLRHG